MKAVGENISNGGVNGVMAKTSLAYHQKLK